jgi:hypothetical protein
MRFPLSFTRVLPRGLSLLQDTDALSDRRVFYRNVYLSASPEVHLPVVLVKWLGNRSHVPERAGSVKVFTALSPRDIPGVRGALHVPDTSHGAGY